jgi:hypothetical protein
MLVGWRMENDLVVLAALPDGTLHIDVLAGTATHSSSSAIELWIAGELQGWLLNRLAESGIEASEIRVARLTAAIRTDRIATNRKRIVSFDFAVQSIIETSEREYRGALHEVHKWHTRVPADKTNQPTRENARR